MPLDPKLNKYSTASPAQAIYNYEDVANGTGVSVFYGKISEAASDEYFLSSDSSYGEDSVETGTINFDLTPFNIPRTPKGTAEILFTGRGTTTQSWSARLYHYDGSTETAISDTVTTKTGSAEDLKVILRLPLTEKLFRKGEILRLKMTTGSPGIHLSDSQPLKLNMPFKINI